MLVAALVAVDHVCAEPIWDKEHIASVEITFKEDLGCVVPPLSCIYSSNEVSVIWNRMRGRYLASP